MTSLTTSEGFEWLRHNIRFPKWNVRVQQLVPFRLLNDNQTGLRPYTRLCWGRFQSPISGLGLNVYRFLDGTIRSMQAQFQVKIHFLYQRPYHNNNHTDVLGTNTLCVQ